MARDRLAAIRAQQQQQQQGGGYNTEDNSYPTQASYNAPSRYQQQPSAPAPPAGGYQSRRPNPYAQQDDRYEMAQVQNTSRTNLNVPADDMTAFYDEISSIQDKIAEFNDNVRQISELHSRSLNNTDEASSQRITTQLDNLVDETSAASAELKRRIQTLARQKGNGREGQIKSQQTNLVKSKFVEAIQNYQTVEQQYRQRYKSRMERQFKIVKPDATDEEVRAVVNDEQGGQIFSQALLSSNRYGESRAAYREVQERHEDIKRIEQTLAELAQLFNDMSILVEQQDETINTIETVAVSVEKDTEAGLGYTDKAVDSARAARKKRWICFIITLIILAIIAIVVAVVVTNQVKNNKS